MFFLHFSLTLCFHLFFSPSPNRTPLPLSRFFPFPCILSPFSPLAFLYHLHTLYPVYCNSCHVSILSLHPYPFPHAPLHLLPFTPFASDSVRQPLSAWLKSSGPTGRAKPWVCFPSERLLFAHSGN